MAENTLVSPHRPFFEALRGVVRAVDQHYGPLYFAGALRLEDRSAAEWILLIGSEKLSRDRAKSIHWITAALARSVAPEHANLIRHVDVLEPDDPFFQAITSAIAQPLRGITGIHNCRFGDIDVGDLALFVSRRRSKPPKQAKPKARTSRPSSLKTRRRTRAVRRGSSRA